MKLDTFFDKFELFADAPNAVRKMRELVLQLAMQGKLVEQRPEEQSAVEVVANLAALSARRGGRVKFESGSDLFVEGWYEIPSSWRWVSLNLLGEIIGGGTPRSDNPAYFTDDGVPWLTPADLNGFKGKRIFRGRRCITNLGLKESSATLLPAGSVLFSSRAPIGYVAIAGTDLATNQGFKSCVPYIKETNEYLYYYLKSAAERIDREASGTTFKEVSGKIVSQIPVALPPLAEQIRIVAKVDELMALCDRLEAQQQQRAEKHSVLARAAVSRFADAPKPANLDFIFHNAYAITPADLRKTILTLAVQGKLVPQHEENEVGTLESVLAEASINGVSKGPTSNELATEILRISAGTSREDFFVNEDDFKHVELSSSEVEKYRLAPGDLLACRFNGNLHFVGRFSLYRGESGRVQVNPDKLIRFRIDTERHSSRYVCYAMNAAPTRAVIESMCATTAGNIGLSAGRLKTVEISLPPLAEQKRIVAKVDELMKLVDQLETQLAASSQQAEQLMNAIVAELTAA